MSSQLVSNTELDAIWHGFIGFALGCVICAILAMAHDEARERQLVNAGVLIRTNDVWGTEVLIPYPLINKP